MQRPAGEADTKTGAELAGNVTSSSRAMSNDVRPFALVINTAPDEFVFVGANGDPSFAVDLPGLPRVGISSRDEGRFENGTWAPGRRLNGDEVFQPGLPSGKIGMLKVKLVRFE
jgi:hypothetical protein